MTSSLKRFEGKKVLVTGASQGIGEATALYFAEHGARVALNGRKAEKLQAVLEKMPKVSGGAHVIAEGDLSDESHVLKVVKESIEGLGGLDILICNAGFNGASHPSEEYPLSDFEAVMKLNVYGVMVACRETIKYWLGKDQKGVIVVNSSVHQHIAKPSFVAYSASKGAVGNMIKTLGLEYASRGIRINAVAPGAIVTPINDAWIHDEKKVAEISAHIPLGRPGVSKEIADAIGFLSGEESTYITGQTLYVDGGLTLYNDFAQNWSS
ncbi:glucose 1-dehydrogenase [Acetobacteraceae bacterium]|nr:glucose 1-dehydrogenase [Acetobacteraceae bacterium]